jgi:hypothetical protein
MVIPRWSRSTFAERMGEFNRHPLIALVGLATGGLCFCLTTAAYRMSQPTQSVLSRHPAPAFEGSIFTYVIATVLWAYLLGSLSGKPARQIVFLFSLFGAFFFLGSFAHIATSMHFA